MSYAHSIQGTDGAAEVIAEYTVKSTDFNGTIQPALPSVAADSTGTCVVTVSRQFKLADERIGQSQVGGAIHTHRVIVSLPDGLADPAGLGLESAVLSGPASGSYAAGNRPRVTLTWRNSTAGALTPASQTYKIQLVRIP